MEIPKTYEPRSAEERWYSHWMAKGYFHSEPDDREPFTVVIPPPNVTGVLHMGHMLNNTIQDVLVRKARMEGKNACWVPGTDHASIATEAKVVHKLREEGIKKSDLSREEFLKHAFAWKEKYGGVILQQLKKLGASCDWERTAFTMDPEYSDSVIDVFIDLFNKGKIYRGVRMINWDPEARTALSDEEVIHKEVNSKLFHVRYKVAGTDDQWLTIATTRPETILGDSAICIHPDDERYKHLHGKHAIVPIANRTIPIICDEYVEMEFGTGCLKVTPAHDVNDYELGKKYDLETIDIFNDNGVVNEHGLHYAGMDRFDVRKEIAKELDDKGYLVKVEDHINKIGYSERTNCVIEPRLSLQWFVSMKELAQPALENVMNGNISFHPDKFKNTYRHWMENVKDWCISRQLWWGHRIPAWYFGENPEDFVIAKTGEEALKLASEKAGKTISAGDLKQDEDVLDTWFSSWLWPISVFNGLTQPGNKEIKYYYPTNDLVTAPEIMFFWVARMIIAGYEYMGELPFRNVYYTGIVRDKLGRKMSKSLGNSPDPIELIEKYGADGVRLGILISSPAGNDLPFDSSQCEQGRNFTNKIWNAARLIKGWEVKPIEQPKASIKAIEWFHARFNQELENINELMAKFKISEALMAIYKLVWDDFCAWYLEMIKPGYEQPIDQETLNQTIVFFEKLLCLLQPFTPFVAEELWHLLRERKEGEDIIIAKWPTVEKYDAAVLKQFGVAEEVVTNIRNIRKKNNIANKVRIELFVKKNMELDASFDAVILKMGNLSLMEYTNDKIPNANSFLVQSNEYFIPFGDAIDVSAEKEKMEEELNYTKGFLKSVQGKLSNEKFVSGAPEQVLANERKKEADALQKIAILEEKLASLN
ncbi:valine--tRNA ligase [Fluviicola chungangensis]|uniref:Valine--tRNA ligase n=1 Tax=Fluviicola chungangensis TaxID=2597671 RepID=A0A556N0X9_9FLAO|nr:valine--tRNA ligase [Fluviicola chungangensis]TSJ45854.1 valine--tRNA ligase [Fluviicola chungangensis]